MQDITFYGQYHSLQESMADFEHRQKLRADGGKYIGLFRYQLESAIDNIGGGSWEKLLDTLDEGYRKRIYEIKNQEDFDFVYRQIFDVEDTASIVADNQLQLKGNIEYQISQIEFTNFFCPCCGKELDDEFVDKLRHEVDNCERLAWFYDSFKTRRKADREKLKKIAEEKEFSLDSWCPMYLKLHPTSRHQRVEENVKKMSMEEQTRIWIAKKKAEGKL